METIQRTNTIRPVEDYIKHLQEAVAAAREKPFEWGRHDCSLFVADCVLAMTGIDYGEAFRGDYSTAWGANRILEPHGGLVGYMDTLFERVPIQFAKRGDVVMSPASDMPAIGMCMGLESWFLTKDDGLTWRPTLDCAISWAVASAFSFSP